MKSDCEIAYPPETSIQDDDREEFLDLLSQSASKHALDFLARCLMRSSARILMELLNHDPYAKGQQSERWEERLWGGLVGSAVHHPVAGRSSVVRSEREEVLLLENNSRATRRCSNNIKKRLTGKALR
jgi:hypothetical protein